MCVCEYAKTKCGCMATEIFCLFFPLELSAFEDFKVLDFSLCSMLHLLDFQRDFSLLLDFFSKFVLMFLREGNVLFHVLFSLCFSFPRYFLFSFILIFLKCT